jgi:hypothetical protein
VPVLCSRRVHRGRSVARESWRWPRTSLIPAIHLHPSPREGVFISGLRVCRFGVTQTPVGGFANGPKGIPVLRTDTASDSEVTGIADDGLGSQRPSLFEVLLDPRRLVVTSQSGVHTPSHDPRAKLREFGS